MSTRQIQGQLKEENTTMSHGTIHKTLCEDENIKWSKFKPSIMLSSENKEARLKWALKYASYCASWDDVIWSDEKV